MACLRSIVGAVFLALAISLGFGWQVGLTQQASPSPEPPLLGSSLPCVHGPLLLTSSLAPPSGLSSALVPWILPNVFAVQLRWQPIAGATCVSIEERGPGFGPSPNVSEAAGTATEGEVLPAQMLDPGQYCFRILAVNDLGRSDYSNETCIDVPGALITYQSGWNLVGVGPAALAGVASGAVYTNVPGGTGYQALPPDSTAQPSAGYWAYFPVPTTLRMPDIITLSPLVVLPAGRFVLIGNSSAVQSMTVSGADVVYTYDPASGSYQQTATLEPGRGAWAYSAAGATITISPVSP